MLFIEMKRSVGGVISSEQKEWNIVLNQYPDSLAAICKGFDEAKQFIDFNIYQKYEEERITNNRIILLAASCWRSNSVSFIFMKLQYLGFLPVIIFMIVVFLTLDKRSIYIMFIAAMFSVLIGLPMLLGLYWALGIL